MIFQIEVISKEGFSDPHGKRVLEDITNMGIKKILDIKYCPIYTFHGETNLLEINMIAKSLLVDPVTQTYSLFNPSIKRDKKDKKESCHEVEIWFNNGVSDSVAQTILKSMEDMRLYTVLKVRTGHKFFVETKMSKNAIEQIVKQVLVNPLIQNFKIR
jgi:phosphoribosylformylglycinamidine synthase